MCKPRQVLLRNLGRMSPEKKAFFESTLREMEALADDAGDWRIHLPYEALVGYQMDSNVRAQYSEHYDNCSFCQKAMDALNPYDE
mgnify:CR=1 FL=1